MLPKSQTIFQTLSVFFKSWGWFWKLLVWAIIPLAVIAYLTWMNNRFTIEQDQVFFADPSFFLISLSLHILIVHFFSSFIRGVMATAYGARVKSFSIGLRWGLIPRFQFQISGMDELSRKQQLWLYSSTLIFRLYLFIFGTFVWYWNSGTASSLKTWGIILANLGLLSFLIGVLPIRPTAPGVKIGCLLCNKSRNYPQQLLRRTLKTLNSLIRNPASVFSLPREVWLLLLAGGTIAAMFGFVLFRLVFRISTKLADVIPDILGQSTSYVILALILWLFLKSFRTKLSQRGKMEKKTLSSDEIQLLLKSLGS